MMAPEKCLVAIFNYNEGERLRATLDKIPSDFPYPILIHDDGSTDHSLEIVKKYGFKWIQNSQRKGIGKSIKNAIRYAIENKFEAIVITPGNNKNDPAEATRLLEPILSARADYVQGSRFLKGSRRDNTPIFRRIMVRVHALMFTLIAFRWCSDALEGYRAYRLDLFNDPRINIWQDWLDTYEFEMYLHYKVLTLGKRYAEAPVSKIYPLNRKSVLRLKKGARYSHIRPIIDWWHIMKPVLFLLIGLRK